MQGEIHHLYKFFFFLRIEEKFDHLAEQMKEMRHEHDVNDLDLNQLEEEFLPPSDLSSKKQSILFLNFISYHTARNKDNDLFVIDLWKN